MKTVIIITNSYYLSSKADSQATQLKAAIENENMLCYIVKSEAVSMLIDSAVRIKYISDCTGKIIDVSTISCCVFFDKDYYLAKALESIGIRLVNSAEAIKCCDDKMLTQLCLSGQGIAMPKTIFSPLKYRDDILATKDFVINLELSLNYPMIIKCSKGSLGSQVFLVKDGEERESIEKELGAKRFFYQELIEGNDCCARDIRVVVIGGRAVGAMERINDNDFRNNIEKGARGVLYTLNEKIEEIAVKASKILGLNYAGVDIVLGKNDKPYLIEVNSNCYIDEFCSITGIDAYETYAKYMSNSFLEDK